MDITDLGALIRAARKERNWTQEQLAQQAGVSRYTIMQLESGRISDLGIRKVMSIMGYLALEMHFQKAQSRRPTLQEMYALNDRERQEHANQFRRRRERV